MRAYALPGLTCLAALLGIATASAQQVVTIYSADGLHDGSPSWFGNQFDAFTKATGIKVQYVEGGSGVVVERVAKEATNTQADVLVTLPPFIQKAAADGLLAPSQPAAAAAIPADGKDPQGRYYALVNNYLCFIYNGARLDQAPANFNDLLDAKFKNKLQYSTPGQAGDGTAVMLQVAHAFGGKDAGFAYLGNGEEVGQSLKQHDKCPESCSELEPSKRIGSFNQMVRSPVGMSSCAQALGNGKHKSLCS
jgi:2-aminoethylphosphonate transport system substrate-binding protein